MANNQINVLLEFANMQMASEAFLLRDIDSGVLPDEAEIVRRLVQGNTRVSKFVPVQAERFTAQYEVLAQYRNDSLLPGNTGFSGTLFRNRATGERTLSIRSTEFIDDAARDNKATNQLELKELGWGFGQIAEMEAWYAQLRTDPNLLAGRNFNVTGYSLGGHLATAFNILRREEYAATPEFNPIIATYTFNGAGTGGIVNGMRLTDLIANFNRIRANYTASGEWTAMSIGDQAVVRAAAQKRVDATLAERVRVGGLTNLNPSFGASGPNGIQSTLEYQIAALLVAQNTVGMSNFLPAFGGTNFLPTSPVFADAALRFGNMTEVVGMETAGLATSFTSNSGIHYGNRQELHIEAQPLYRGNWLSSFIDEFASLLVNDPEKNNFGDTHSLVLVIDSLSLMAAMERLAPSITIETAGQIFAAMSIAAAATLGSSQGKAEGDSLERMLDALNKLVMGSRDLTLGDQQMHMILQGNTWHDTAFRGPFQIRLTELGDYIDEVVSVPGVTFTIDPLVSTSATRLAALGMSPEAIAYRYALKELNPFVVQGDTANSAFYDRYNLAGELDLYDGAARTGTMTAEWIADRAAFLPWKSIANTINTTAVSSVQNAETWRYADLPQKYSISVSPPIAGGGVAAIAHRAAFGGDVTDLVIGGNREDRLYGMGGTDVLSGKAGDDYLEGGVGLDVYSYSASTVLSSSNDGNDTILDTDGKGVLRYTFRDGLLAVPLGKAIGGAALRRSDNQWQSADGKFTFSRNGADLNITITGDAGGSLRLKDWRTGDFGIRLLDIPTTPQTTRTIEGDRKPAEFTQTVPASFKPEPDWRNTVIIGTQLDAGSNPVSHTVRFNRIDDIENLVAGDALPESTDSLNDSAGNDLIELGGGDDVVQSARGGNDWVQAGAGRDTITTGGGKDLVESGFEADIIHAGGGDDRVFAHSAVALNVAIEVAEIGAPQAGNGDLLAGGAGDDIVVGSATADVVFGGADQDVIVGGAGDDTIYGDGDLASASLNWTITRTATALGPARIFDVIFFDAQTQGLESTATGQADALYGGAGADWIFAGAGDDYIDAGSGDDAILGEAGSDVVIGGAGNDFLDGDSSDTTALGLAGDDYLDGGEGDDTLVGEAGDDVLFGSIGDDAISGGAGADVLVGGPGTDVLAGGTGKDTYFFDRGDGIETIIDVPSGADDPEASVLVLGEGISPANIKLRLGSLMVDLGNGDAIHFEGFDVADPLSTPLVDSIQFDDGTFMDYQDVLDLGFEIDGTEDDDVIDGTAVTDRVDSRGGNDIVSGRTGDDSISGGAGNDVLLGEAGNDTLSGGEGMDSLDGDYGEDVLAGDAGSDELFGGGGNDILGGGADEDRLTGDGGDDVLTGGAGSDVLIGNDGSDVYAFSTGDGQDRIDEQGVLAANLFDTASIDVVRFGEGIALADVTLAARGNGDLIIRFGTDDQLTIQGQYRIPGNAIERIEFADGTVLGSSALNVLPIMPIEGTAGDDVLYGTEGNDTLLGFAGNDVLDGGLSPDDEKSTTPLIDNDRLEGGSGADTYAMYLGMGTDTIVDRSEMPAEIGTLTLAAGLTLDSVRTQRRGDDLFVGLRSGQEGALIAGYYDAAEPVPNWQVITDDGTATPIEEVINRPDPTVDDVAAAAREDYKQSVLSSWSVLSRSAQLPTHALVFNSWSQTTVLFQPDFNLPPTVTLLPPNTFQFIENFGTRQGNAFAPASNVQTQVTPVNLTQETDDAIIRTQGFSHSSEQQLSYGVTLGSVAKNVSGSVSTNTVGGANTIGLTNIIVTSTNESWRNITLTLNPGSGFDGTFTVFQNSEQRVIEEINAGDGANQIQGALGSTGKHVALIDAGGGNDIVNAGAYDFVYGNDGSDLIRGGRIVYGGNDSDTLIDGATLYGGAGSDALSGGAFMAGGEDGDFLSGKEGATVFFVNPQDAGEDFVEDLGGIEPTLFDDRYYQSIGIENPAEHIDFAGMYVVFDDTTSSWDRIVGIYEGWFAPRPDSLLGVRDRYSGNSDADAVAYFTLEDLQSEFVRFGIPYVASDIRYIEPLPTVPQVTANDYAALEPLYAAGLIERDAMEFGPGIGFDDLGAYLNETGNLALTWGAGKVVHVTLPIATDLIGTGVERFTFADGTTVTLAQMLEKTSPVSLPTIVGTQDGDNLIGTANSERILGLGGADGISGLEGDDELDGGAGEDNLSGGLGNDTLVGGRGNDNLDGGEGDEVYVFGQGDGIDFAFDEGGADSVRFAQGIVPADIAVTNNPYGTLYLVRTGSGDRLALSDWSTDPARRIENVQFANGTVWDATELQSHIATLSASEFSDILTETDNDDTVDGLGGNDEIYGLGGDDVLAGGAGDDYMEGGAGSDILRGGDGSDGPSDWQGNNFLEGGAGDDNLYADGAPNFADGGNNFVLGGAGDDRVNSYAAGNVIAFNPGDGHDTVYAANSLTLSLGGGIAPSALSLSQDGTDLVLTIGANDSIRLTRQFEVDPETWPRITLQLFGSVHFYDFNAVIADFRQVVSTDPLLQDFALDAVLQTTAVSETEALGGALAHRYAITGNLNGLSDTTILQVLGNPDFGAALQTIRTGEANHAPTLANPISDQIAFEDAGFSFVVPATTFSDSDLGDSLNYIPTRADGSPLPAWLAFNAVTRIFSGTPANGDVGTVSVRIAASDGANAPVSDLFDLTVTNTNDTPVLGHPIADQSARAGVAFDFALATDAFHDIDPGEVLSYRATLANGDRLPAWLSFDAASRNFSGTPAVADAGAISIRVTASDLAGTGATDDFELVVSDGGTGHGEDPGAMNHNDDRGHDHGKRDDEHHRKRHGSKHDDRDEDRSEHKADRITQWLTAYFERKPDYDFEALAQELKRSDRHREALNTQEIARRWRAVDRYASALSSEHDEDARGGADYRFNDHGWLGGGAFGDGIGHSASTGALRRGANLQTLQGLEEGFQWLHS